MTRIRVAALAAIAGVVVTSSTAEAQRYRWDVGVNGGFGYWTNMLTEEHTGVEDLDVKFDAGWLSGAQLGFWFSPRVGLRANFGYTDRPIEADDADLTTVAGGDLDHINLWSGSGDVLFRLRAPNEEWNGREFLPYLALGLGAKWHNPAGDNYTLIDGGESASGVPFTTGAGADATTFFLKEANTLMGLVGVGADYRLSPNFALRLEVGDRIFDPQIAEVTPDATEPDTYVPVAGDEDVGKTVHELYGTLGIHYLFGLSRPQPVAVVTPPPPAPAPEPEPAPREEAISVCVIDPTATTGLRTVNALYLPETGDTVMVMGLERRPLRDAVGEVSVAATSDWYIRGEPMTITFGNTRWEYVSYGASRAIDPYQVVFLGTVNGVPVYADANDVADIRTEISTIAPSQPLTQTLATNARLRSELNDVRVLYVPLQPTGCIFQAVTRQEQVRKNR